MPQMHRLLTLFVCAVALTAVNLQPAKALEAVPAPQLVIREIGPGLVPIDGQWQFRLGDDPQWANPGYDDSQWEQIKADDTWGSQSHPSYTGFAWYRRHLDLPPAAVANQKLAILMPPVDDAYELFWNGQKIGSLGKIEPPQQWFFEHRQSFALPISSSGTTEGLLAVRVWKLPLNAYDVVTGGGLNAPPVVGDSAVIAAEVGQGDFLRMRSSLYGRAISFFFLLIGTVALIAWLRDHGQRVFLWFAVWLLAKVALYYLSSDRMIEWISEKTFADALLALHSIVDCSLFLLLLYLFKLQDNLRRWTSIAIGVNVGLAVVNSVLLEFWANAGPTWQRADLAFTVLWTLSELFVFVLIYQGWQRKPDLPVKVVAITALLVYVHEIIRLGGGQGRRFTHWIFYQTMSPPLIHVLGAGVTSRQILETLLLISLAYALLRYALEQRRHEQEIEIELKSAGEVQRIMIPEVVSNVPGYAIESAYQPALEAGGDFFQIIPLEDKSTLVVLGDVSGKGLKAAMNVSLIVGILRALAESNADPSSILLGLNRLLTGRLQGGFVTALAFRVDELGNCSVANAGHLEPFLNGKELAIQGSIPLGIFSETDYEQQYFNMSEGDRLIIYTDGVLEARNKQNELYGFERTRILLGGDPSAEFIAATAVAFGQEDDITVLTIRRLPKADEWSIAMTDVASL